ncbi:hypothetical protein [Haloimpatiens massiliensis]|uniref:hypothetical protein n=1 Tax=Haloimpatiens massiliensis TaxID=1658110 RepID=UPI001FA8CE47|nr:hypothetical protein [Haloimpatiens massiliensis]
MMILKKDVLVYISRKNKNVCGIESIITIIKTNLRDIGKNIMRKIRKILFTLFLTIKEKLNISEVQLIYSG